LDIGLKKERLSSISPDLEANAGVHRLLGHPHQIICHLSRYIFLSAISTDLSGDVLKNDRHSLPFQGNGGIAFTGLPLLADDTSHGSLLLRKLSLQSEGAGW